MTNLCNLNGTVLPEDEARLPVLDRGFLFGDSVYEVIRTRFGRPFAWREHLQRMRASADAIALPIDLEDRALMLRLRETLAQAGPGEKYVRIIVSRGTGTAPNIDLAYAPGPANVVLLVRDLEDTRGKPARLAIVPRLRTDRRALDPAIKSGNYLNNVLGLSEAKRAGATDCLFLNHAGCVTEASTSNFYLVGRDGVVATPPSSAGLLLGITRRLLIECAGGAGVSIVERDCTRQDVLEAAEAFLSSTLRDISPVTHVDDTPIHGGTTGPVTEGLMRDFAEFCDRKAREQDGPAFDAL